MPGVFSLGEEAVYETILQVMPLIAGHLLVPRVTILKYTPPPMNSAQSPGTDSDNVVNEEAPGNTENSENHENHAEIEQERQGRDTKNMSVDEEKMLDTFAVGQVYCASSGSQVHVLPSSNTSSIDVTTA